MLFIHPLNILSLHQSRVVCTITLQCQHMHHFLQNVWTPSTCTIQIQQSGTFLYIYCTHPLLLLLILCHIMYCYRTTPKGALLISKTPSSSPKWLTHNPSFPWYVHLVPVCHGIIKECRQSSLYHAVIQYRSLNWKLWGNKQRRTAQQGNKQYKLFKIYGQHIQGKKPL